MTCILWINGGHRMRDWVWPLLACWYPCFCWDRNPPMNKIVSICTGTQTYRCWLAPKTHHSNDSGGSCSKGAAGAGGGDAHDAATAWASSAEPHIYVIKESDRKTLRMNTHLSIYLSIYLSFSGHLGVSACIT